MKWIVGGIASIVGALLSIPALLSIASPVMKGSRSREPHWIPLGALSLFPVGAMTEVTLARTQYLPKGLYVLRKSHELFNVYSRSCTDLGCPIKWDERSEVFLCPCHGGMFSKDGDRMAGPPKMPLFRYNFRIKGEQLEIDVLSVPVVA